MPAFLLFDLQLLFALLLERIHKKLKNLQIPLKDICMTSD